MTIFKHDKAAEDMIYDAPVGTILVIHATQGASRVLRLENDYYWYFIGEHWPARVLTGRVYPMLKNYGTSLISWSLS